MTKKSATALAGLGLMGVAKDTYPHDGDTYSFVVGFAEVEVDVETGKTRLVDYLAVGDVGTVINPRSLHGQLLGGINLGIGHALQQKWVYDPHYGVPLAKRFYHNKPLTILDIPADDAHARRSASPDPETPVGARGVGEPPVGAGYGSVMNAIADAVGEDDLQAGAGDRRHRADVSNGRRPRRRGRPWSVGSGPPPAQLSTNSLARVRSSSKSTSTMWNSEMSSASTRRPSRSMATRCRARSSPGRRPRSTRASSVALSSAAT